MIHTRLIGALALSTIASTGIAQAQDATADATAPAVADTLAEGLVHPWGMDFLPDGRAIVTEREGTMRLVSAEGELSDPVEGVPEVWASGQGGLLDVAAAPDFAETGTIFFTFSEPGEGGAGTAVARAELVEGDGSASLEGVEVIFTMNRKTDAGQHFGSRIAFGPDGSLHFTIGDRGDGPRAQDPQDHAGSVLRIGQDGAAHADNPGGEWLPEIYSIGHRNPQGLVWDPVTGALWSHEHGPRGGDELNRPEVGLNYGWPEVSLGVNYDGSPVNEGEAEAEGVEQPVHFWDPSPALSGFAVYEGEMFPEWQGDFLIGALAQESLIRLDRDEAGAVTGDEERLFEGELGRIRDVAVAPDGSLWLLTDDANGQIVRVSRGD